MPTPPFALATRFVLCAALAGCAASPLPSAPTADTSLYQRLGGRPALETMVDDAIVNISKDTRINRRFVNANGPGLKRNLVDFLCERAGGPCVYKGLNMADAHENMHVSDAEFDALVEDLALAMDRAKVGPREKAESLAILAKLKNAVTGH